MYIDLTTECGCDCPGCGYTFPANNNSEFIQIPLDPAFPSAARILNTFTLEFWFKFRSVSGTRGIITTGVSPVKPINSFGVFQFNDRLIFHASSHLDVPAPITLPQTYFWMIVVNNTNWNHVVFVRNKRMSHEWRVFLNGKEVYTSMFNGPGYPASFQLPGNIFYNTFYIGRDDVITNNRFDGSIAQVRLYEREMLAAEAYYNYRNGFYKPRDQEHLALWVPLTQCWGNTATAISPIYNNIGTIVNADPSRTMNPPYPAWSENCPKQESKDCMEDEKIYCPIEPDPLVVSECDNLIIPPNNIFRRHQISTVPIGFMLNCKDLRFETFNRIIPFDSVATTYSEILPDFLPGEIIFRFKVETQKTYVYALAKIDCENNVTIETRDLEIIDETDFYKIVTVLISHMLGGSAATTDKIQVHQIGKNYFEIKVFDDQLVCDALPYEFFYKNLDNYDTTDKKKEAAKNELETIINKQTEVLDICKETNPCVPRTVVVTNICLSLISQTSCKKERPYIVTIGCNIPSSLPENKTGICMAIKPNTRFAYGATTGIASIPNNILVCSQPIKYVSRCDSFLLRFKNKGEQQYIVRIEGKVQFVGISKRQEVTYTPLGINRKLYSAVSEEYEIITAPYTERFHKLLAKALEYDHVQIDYNGLFIDVVAEESYNIEWNSEDMPNRKGIGRIKLKARKREITNSFE